VQRNFLFHNCCNWYLRLLLNMSLVPFLGVLSRLSFCCVLYAKWSCTGLRLSNPNCHSWILQILPARTEYFLSTLSLLQSLREIILNCHVLWTNHTTNIRITLNYFRSHIHTHTHRHAKFSGHCITVKTRHSYTIQLILDRTITFQLLFYIYFIVFITSFIYTINLVL
jgi:hypothetical protein